MIKAHANEGSQQAVNLIEAQLQALAISVALVRQCTSPGVIEEATTASLVALGRKSRPHETGSGGNIVMEDGQGEVKPAPSAHSDMPQRLPLQENDYLRVVVGNALLVVRLFLAEHAMGKMRTPEIQFLGHACDALLNGNRFDIDPGYMPMATFDGLTIDSDLHGQPLFGDSDGFMGFGDAVALLQWLSHFFNREKHFVTGGDAG